MSIQQSSFYCPVCQQQRLFTRQRSVNHVLHLLIMVFSCGLWGIVWAILILSDNPQFHCAQCGYSDAVKYLTNPNLRSEEAQGNAEWRLQGDNATQTVSPLLGVGILFMPYIFAWFTLREGYSSLAKKLSFGWLILVVISNVFVFGYILPNQKSSQVKNDTSNSQLSTSSNANTNASPQNIVYPAGLSSEENLKKGKEALSRGDEKTAWNHLFQIKKGAKEFSSAQLLLASIDAHKQIEFELADLDEREANLKSMSQGLAYKVEPSELKKRLDNIEKQLRAIFARREELQRKLKMIK